MKFGIRHYAGDVMYDVNGLLEKNRDTFRDDMLKVLKDTKYEEYPENVPKILYRVLMIPI